MNAAQDLSILAMMLNASLVVQLVLLLLLVVSFMSWYFIFLKAFSIRRAEQKTETRAVIAHLVFQQRCDRDAHAGIGGGILFRKPRRNFPATAIDSRERTGCISIGGARRVRQRNRKGARITRDRRLWGHRAGEGSRA